MGKFNKNPFAMFLSLLLLAACANERPVKKVIEDNHRISKRSLAGDKLFMKSVQDVRNSGGLVPLGAVGIYLEGNRIVNFEIKQNVLNIRATRRVVLPGTGGNTKVEIGKVLASFPITHVDVLRKQNTDGNDTHEEEVTETRRPWQEREFIKIDFTKDAKDFFGAQNVRYVVPPESVEFDNERGAINFSIQKELKDGSQVTVRHSFLNFDQTKRPYEQRTYPKYHQTRFGFFKTTTYEFDKFGRATDSGKKDFIDRWDLSKKIVYHMSEGYPEHLKPATYEVFKKWNAAWKAATGVDEVLELRENTGQKPGDLRYNMLYFDNTEGGGRLLGYGPSITNPRTGEIVKADVFLYGGTLKSSVYYTRLWADAFEKEAPPAPAPTGGTGGGGAAGGVPAGFMNLGDLAGNIGVSFDKVLDLNAGLMNFDEIKSVRAQDEEIINQFFTHAPDGSRKFRTSELYQQVRNSLLGKSERLNHEREEFEGSGLHQNVILMDENHLANIKEGALVKDLSDEELEIRIFMPLLAHELGHNFGLRHNFMASADKKHHHKHESTSSVMDYAFGPQEPAGPAAYDVAALKYAYGPNDARSVAGLIAENFYFCTDHEVFSSQNILCGQHDAGTNLLEVAENLEKRYDTNYEITNKRLDRAFFFNDGTYFGRIARFIIPMRLLYDHANAIVKYDQEFQDAQSGSPQQMRALSKIWSLLRHRVEADSSSTSAFPFPVSNEVVVILDGNKIQAAVDEADQARRKAFDLLKKVVEGTPDKDGFEKPEYDGADFVHNELVIKGVLLDKILGMLMIGARTGDPITGEATTMYEDMDEELADMFRRVLSNTTNNDLEFFNTNLRYIAVDLIASELGLPGRLSAESIELLHLEPLNGSSAETEKLQKVEASRKALQTFFYENEASQVSYIRLLLDRLEIQLGLLKPDLTPEKKAELEQALADINKAIEERDKKDAEEAPKRQKLFEDLRQARRDLNLATVTVGGETFKAPINLGDTELGLEMDTATGALLLDNNNLIEDRLIAMKDSLNGPLKEELDKAKAELAANPEDIGKQRVVRVLENIENSIKDRIRLFRRYIQMEKQFVAALYRLYKPN